MSDDLEVWLELRDRSEALSEDEASESEGDTEYEAGGDDALGTVTCGICCGSSGTLGRPVAVGRVVNLGQVSMSSFSSEIDILLRGSRSKMRPKMASSSAEMGKMVLRNLGFLE